MFTTITAHRFARLLTATASCPIIPGDDAFAAAASRALPPPSGMRLLTGGADGPGAAEAQALATLAALSLLSPKVRSPLELVAAALRLSGGALDEGRLVAAATGGCVRVTCGVDGPRVERVDPVRRRVRREQLRVLIVA